MDAVRHAEWEARAARSALDYFQSVCGFSYRQAHALTLRFIVHPSQRDLRIMREEVDTWQHESR